MELNEVLPVVFAMGATILFCRACAFLFFNEKSIEGRGKRTSAFLNFVEKIVPPVAMTVLAFNILGGAFRGGVDSGLLALLAAGFTAAVHLWKGNPLLSIFGGTAVYMILQRVM
jgi:branched-subunit amino acid transport protein AzlD